MQAWVREHVPATTVLLTVLSLALVFGAVLGAAPAALPRIDPLVAVVPHVNAAVSVAALASIVGGVRAIRRGDVAAHRRRMGTAFVLFVAFLALYLYKVSVAGPTDFAGPAAVERFVYLPVLAVHTVLAIVCLPLLYYVLLLALTRPVAELPDTPHPTVGRIAAALWALSFVLGIVVYAMLYLVY